MRHDSFHIPSKRMEGIRRILPILLLAAMLLAGGLELFAQSSLTGMVFGNPDIGAGAPDRLATEVKNRIAQREKKLGRKLTEAEKKAEKKKVGDEVLKNLDADQVLQLISTISITVKFLPDSKAEMKMKMSLKEDLLKEAGVSWVKRKAMKAMVSIGSNTVKERYVRKGNLIIISPGNEPDTLRLSPDGRRLYGKIDEGLKFTLSRQASK